MNFTFRPATPADADFSFHAKKVALGLYIEKTWGWDEQFQLQFHKNSFDPAKTEIILLNNAPIGWLRRSHLADCLELNEIYLVPKYQRQGIGGRIIHECIMNADARGTPIKLRVLKVNPARFFYERHGFVVESEEEYHYNMIKSPNNAIQTCG